MQLPCALGVIGSNFNTPLHEPEAQQQSPMASSSHQQPGSTGKKT
jgi:hypothetical protein